MYSREFIKNKKINNGYQILYIQKLLVYHFVLKIDASLQGATETSCGFYLYSKVLDNKTARHWKFKLIR